jgi:hypothetical protein
MIPKGISHTSVQNLTDEFQKRTKHFQQGTVILAGYYYWFGIFVQPTGILP